MKWRCVVRRFYVVRDDLLSSVRPLLDALAIVASALIYLALFQQEES